MYASLEWSVAFHIDLEVESKCFLNLILIVTRLILERLNVFLALFPNKVDIAVPPQKKRVDKEFAKVEVDPFMSAIHFY